MISLTVSWEGGFSGFCSFFSCLSISPYLFPSILLLFGVATALTSLSHVPAPSIAPTSPSLFPSLVGVISISTTNAVFLFIFRFRAPFTLFRATTAVFAFKSISAFASRLISAFLSPSLCDSGPQSWSVGFLNVSASFFFSTLCHCPHPCPFCDPFSPFPYVHPSNSDLCYLRNAFPASPVLLAYFCVPVLLFSPVRA